MLSQLGPAQRLAPLSHEASDRPSSSSARTSIRSRISALPSRAQSLFAMISSTGSTRTKPCVGSSGRTCSAYSPRANRRIWDGSTASYRPTAAGYSTREAGDRAGGSALGDNLPGERLGDDLAVPNDEGVGAQLVDVVGGLGTPDDERGLTVDDLRLHLER